MDETDTTILEVGLLIYNFTCDPSVINETLEIEPSETFFNGEKISPKMMLERPYNGWWPDSGVGITVTDFDEHIEMLLSKLESKLNNFSNLPSNCDVQLSSRFIRHDEDERPGFHLPASLIETLSKMRASVDIAIL